jgi:hypothetical protein
VSTVEARQADKAAGKANSRIHRISGAVVPAKVRLLPCAATD